MQGPNVAPRDVAGVQVHEGEFVRVRVPGYLERSLQLALGGVHAPFFTVHEGATVLVVLRQDEWARLAPRFASAEAEPGFRLVSMPPGDRDPDFPARLSAALAGDGLSARPVPSFHHDHLLIASGELERTLAVIRRLLKADSSKQTDRSG